MKLTSRAFSDQGAIPVRFTCDGDDLSPPLDWGEVPDDTAGLVLICEDPDAPRGTFVHWVLWGVPPGTAGLAEGEVPQWARQGRNGFGTVGYRGPCPPPGHGGHHYHFTLYAVREPLAARDGARIEEVRRAIQGRVLATTTLVGTYQR